MAFKDKPHDGLLGLLEHASDAYVLLDEIGVFIETNPAFDARFSDYKITPGKTFFKDFFPGYNFSHPGLSSKIQSEGAQYYLLKIEPNLNQQYSEQILSVIHEVCFHLDDRLNILYANQRALESWGASSESVLGRNIFDILDHIYEPLAEHFQKALHSETRLFEEIYLPKIDRWIFSNAHPNHGGLIVLHTDITEKIKFKTRLKEKELQLKTLVDNIPDLVTRWDKNGKLIFANTSFSKESINLAERKDIKIKQRGVSLPSVDWDGKIKQVCQTGQTIEHHTTLVSETEVAFLDSLIVPEKDAEGNISSVLAISRDVTENMLAQQKIVDSNRLLRSVFDASVNGIVVFQPVRDIHGNSVDFYCKLSNKSAIKILPSDPSGKRFSEFVEEQLFPNYFKTLLRTLEHGIKIQEEVRIRYLHDFIWLDIMVSKIKDGILITFSDISQKKQAEMALLDSYQLLQNLIDGTSVALLYLKPIRDDKGELSDLEFLNINKKAVELLNLQSCNITEERLLHSCCNVFGEQLMNHIRSFINTGSPAQFETSLSQNDNKYFYDFSLTRHDENMILSGMDVTYKVVSQRKIRQMEHRQHKELLNAIMQTQEEERRRVAESLHNEFGQLLNVSLLQLGDNNREVSQLLNKAIVKVRRISHELMPPVLKDFGLEAAFRELFDSSMLSNENIVPKLRISGLKERLDIHLEIALYRIVQEILNNIIKHARASHIDFRLKGEDDGISINLKDDGIGFDTTNKQGFGLKYISSRVQLLNGRLEIVSSKKSGTECKIWIPKVQVKT